MYQERQEDWCYYEESQGTEGKCDPKNRYRLGAKLGQAAHVPYTHHWWCKNHLMIYLMTYKHNDGGTERPRDNWAMPIVYVSAFIAFCIFMAFNSIIFRIPIDHPNIFYRLGSWVFTIIYTLISMGSIGGVLWHYAVKYEAQMLEKEYLRIVGK